MYLLVFSSHYRLDWSSGKSIWAVMQYIWVLVPYQVLLNCFGTQFGQLRSWNRWSLRSLLSNKCNLHLGKIWYTIYLVWNFFSISGVSFSPLCFFLLSLPQFPLPLSLPLVPFVQRLLVVFSATSFVCQKLLVTQPVPASCHCISLPLPPQKLFFLKYNFFCTVEIHGKISNLIFLKHFVAFNYHLYVGYHWFH